ncbi:MAG: TOBE domain-containing protein, partial [Candidatus Tectomicrobia bacterium]
VANFIGDANLVDAEITNVDGERASVRLGSIDIVLPSRGLKPGLAKAAIRPEALRLSLQPATDGMAGCVRKATYLGSHMEYTVDSPLGPLFVVDARIDRPIPTGAAVTVTLAAHGVTLMSPPSSTMALSTPVDNRQTGGYPPLFDTMKHRRLQCSCSYGARYEF